MRKFAKWKNKEICLFLEKLEMYDSAGLPLDKSLNLTSNGLKRRQAETIYVVIEDILAGGSLSGSLRKNLGIANTAASLIENGEISGRLNESIASSRQLLERGEELKRSLFSGMIYPVMIAICATGLVIGLMRGVMPQITPMLRSLNRDLPLLTKVVIVVSEYMFNYGIMFLAGLAGLMTAFFISYRKSKWFRSIVQTTVLKFPIIGNLMFRHFLSVFLYSFGKLFEAGMSLEKAYLKSADTLSLEPFRLKLLSHKKDIEKGIPVSRVFIGLRLPTFISSLAEAGESSGSLGVAACRSAVILEKDLDHDLKRFTCLLEPVLMVFMGGVVAAIALSIMMPIYDISKTLQH